MWEPPPCPRGPEHVLVRPTPIWMVNVSRDPLTEALVDLAQSLVSDYDVGDILDRLCDRATDLLPITGAGVMLLDRSKGDAALVTIAASDARIHAIERLQLELGEGPCLQAWRDGEHVIEPDLEANGQQHWPDFTGRALAAGMASVYSFPLRFNEERIGAINLFSEKPGDFTDEHVQTAELLADMATIYIINARTLGESVELSSQLQRALDGRVIIEQAKGKLSERLGIDVDDAFECLRRYARSNGRRLHDVAQAVVDGDVEIDRDAWLPQRGDAPPLEPTE